MKRGFISIYVLLILLALSISIGFIFTQAENNTEFNDDLYDRKKAQYKAESILNIYLNQNEDEIRNRIASFKENKIYRPNNKVSYKDTSYSLHFYDHVNKIDNEGLYRIATENIKEGNTIATAEAYLKPNFSPLIDNKDIIIIDDNIEKILELLKLNDDMTISKKLPDNNEGIINITSSLTIDKDSPDLFKGVLIIDGDFLIDKDFTVEGLLIVKGEIKADKKLSVRGQLIRKEGKKDNIDFTYTLSNYIKYLLIDEVMINPEIIIKKVY